ncbi:MAG TPA: CBS domain-containing protein, partial [Halothiobacillaceae bacterium]|nr:CBS domain-containing protein [Halothiobacillaceae bacterium]
MSVEVNEIRDHIRRFPPFDRLGNTQLDEIAQSIEIAYYKAGSEITRFGEPIHHLGYVRSGAVEVYRHDGELYHRLSEGGIFGHFGLLRNQQVRYPATAIEDSLIYFVPERVFNHLCEIDGYFADFVEESGSSLQASVEQQQAENDMLVTRVRRLISRAPLLLTADQTVREAALRMTEENASAVLVIRPPVEGDDPSRVFIGEDKQDWFVSGIITDRDMRIRVLAQGLASDCLLEKITTPKLICIRSDESVYEAMLAMLRANVHHLPVLHRRRPVGIVHLSDIIRYETRSSLYLVSNIANQADMRGLERLMPDVRAAFVRLVEDNANAQMVGSALSTIGRALMRRAIELAERELGPPPVAYCYMTNGSMARNEQSIVTDQDNALILADDFDPDQHDEYFQALAQRVSDALDACGYTYCKGGIMAITERWRQPISVWRAYFTEWIDQPDPERLLHSSIFFDLDCVYGDAVLVE